MFVWKVLRDDEDGMSENKKNVDAIKENDRGLIIERKFKLGSKGQFYQTSEGVEGEYEY